VKDEQMTTTKRSLQECLEMLTVGEARAIEKHYGKTLDGGELSGTDLTVGVAWAFERRRALAENLEAMPEWPHFDDWTMKQLNDYFEPEADELDPEEPTTDEGKGDTLAA
jgi:hypothetical protein